MSKQTVSRGNECLAEQLGTWTDGTELASQLSLVSCGAWTPVSFLFLQVPLAFTFPLFSSPLSTVFFLLCIWMQTNILNYLLLYVLVPSAHLIILLSSESGFSKDPPIRKSSSVPRPLSIPGHLASAPQEPPLHRIAFVEATKTPSRTASSKGRAVTLCLCCLFGYAAAFSTAERGFQLETCFWLGISHAP